MSDPVFGPAEFARQIEEAGRAGGWTSRHLSPCVSAPRPWLQRAARTGPQAPTVYISAGIHGDEISGPFALLELLKRPGFFDGFHTILFPLLNPDGLAQNLRHNAGGIDLNRDYRNSKSDEIASHIETLQTLGKFDAAMMLHEDYEGIGAYLYELNEGPVPDLGHRIITAMGRHVPIDLRPEIEEATASGGILQRKDLIAKFGSIEERPDWPEAIYLTQYHTKVSYTTETPKPFPLEHRIAAQIAAVETLLIALRSPAWRSQVGS